MRALFTDLNEKLAPPHTALLIVDMQNDFCADGGYINRVKGKDVSANTELARRIDALTEAGRAAQVLIIWVRAIYDSHYLPAPMLAKQEEIGFGGEGLCLEGSWGADFFVVQPRTGEFVIDKHRYSAFSGTELDNVLRDHGIRTLVMTGVATNVCVESTWRDGFMNGYYIVVPADCVGSHNSALHEASLENVRQTFGTVTDSAEVKGLWSTPA